MNPPDHVPAEALIDRLGRSDGGASDDEQLAALRAKLAEDADADGMLDVGVPHRRQPVRCSAGRGDPGGLARVAFEREDHDVVLSELSERISPRILESHARTDPVARQLDDYFAGRRRQFDVPSICS